MIDPTGPHATPSDRYVWLLGQRVVATRRVAQAAPGGPEWDAAVAHLDEIERSLEATTLDATSRHAGAESTTVRIVESTRTY